MTAAGHPGGNAFQCRLCIVEANEGQLDHELARAGLLH
jgi:hypothetical protein